MNNEEAIAVLRHATDSALFRGDEKLATALVCGINALKGPKSELPELSSAIGIVAGPSQANN